jgi:hypothetical protein
MRFVYAAVSAQGSHPAGRDGGKKMARTREQLRRRAIARLANKEAFPRPASVEHGGSGEQDGMSYREWLVGMIAASLCAPGGHSGAVARAAVAQADAVIDALTPPVDAFEPTEEAEPTSQSGGN